MTACGLPGDGAMCIGPPPKQGGAACATGANADTAQPFPKLQADSCAGARGDGGSLPPIPDAASAVSAPATAALRTTAPLRLILADLTMIACQLLLFVNHYRRLLDAAYCAAAGNGAAAAAASLGPPPGALAAYPCASRTALRIAFLAARAPSTLLAALQLPLGELWVPLVTVAILMHLAALLLLPARTYVALGRRACMVTVGLLPKAVSLATFLALPAEAPSSYFGTYLPIEGAITVWQQVVYNYPFWPGMAVLAAHCALSTAICVIVAPRLAAAGAPPLFSPAWVMAQTYCCAALASCVALQQHPASARELRAALSRFGTAAAPLLRRCCWRREVVPADATSSTRRLPPSMKGRAGGGGAATTAALTATVAEDMQLKAAVRRMLTSVWSSSCCSASSSFTTMTSSASLGSSAAPSEPGSAAGSGSHANAAGVAQAAAASASGGPDAAVATAAPSSSSLSPSQKEARQVALLLLHQQQLRQDSRRAAPVAPSAPLSYQSRAGPAPSSSPGKAVARTATPAGQAAAAAEGMAPAPAAPAPAASQVPYMSPPPSRVAPATAAAPSPPSGALPPAWAFSLKQPTGLSKWTIVEDQEFQPPAAVGVDVSIGAIGHVSTRSRRFRRYQSRAAPQRVHMKLPWAEPDQLPGNFLERLNLALSEGLDCMAVGVAVRAGCIELVFDVVPQAAFDSASDFQAGQSRRRHVQQQHHGSHQPCGAASRTDAAPLQQQQQQRGYQLPLLQPPQPPPQPPQHVPGHLDLLGQVGAVAICGVDDASVGCERDAADAGSVDSHGALEAAVLSGLLHDAEPSSWIDALHLQPPPGAEVLTQACGRVWISRWDHTLRQWVPEKVGGIRPWQLPRMTQLWPPCVVMRRSEPPVGGPAATTAAAGGGAPGLQAAAVLRVSVTNASGATPPAFSARSRGRYLPVVARRVRSSSASGAGDDDDDDHERRGESPAAAAATSPDELAAPATFELELPSGLPRNGLVVVECKVGKLLSNWRPLIVTEDAQLAEELASLLAPPQQQLQQQPADGAACTTATSASAACDADMDAAGWDDLANDLGLWLDYLEVLGLTAATAGSAAAAAAAPAPAAAWGDAGVGALFGAGRGEEEEEEERSALVAAMEAAEAQAGLQMQAGSLDLGPGLAALYATEGYGAHMAGIGASLLEFAVERGWAHTARVLVQQMLAAGVSWPELLRRCSSDGLTLLHRAVRSGRGEMVELVLALGEQHGTPLDWQTVSLGGDGQEAAAGDGAGVTPLHLAASLPDGGRLAERILREYQAACQLWASAVDGHGMRPVDCALASGHLHLADDKFQTHKIRSEGDAAAAATPPAPPQPAREPLPAAAMSPAEPSAIFATSTTVSTTAASSVGTHVGGGCGGGGGDEVQSARAGSRFRSQLGAAAAATAAAIRGAAGLLAAPLVNDPRVEAAYLRAVGAEYVLWCCGYLVYQMCMVFAVAGRMVKELRAHEMVGMALFCWPHVASAALLCANYGAWLRLREPLFAVVTLTRSAAKLLPAMGMMPYPNSATNYLSCGMDVLLEGLIPAYFERMRAPIVLPLRVFEGIATGLLYTSHQVNLRLAPPGVPPLAYATFWTLGCGVLTSMLDAACRRRFAAAGAAAAAGAHGGGAAAVRVRDCGRGSGGAQGRGGAAGETTAGGKGKKMD